MVRADVRSFPYQFEDGTWPTQWGRAAADGGGNGYDSATGIETITVNMNGYADFMTDYNTSKANECAPVSFCAPVSGKCTCQLDAMDPNFNDCQSVCTNWANKDVQCPADKCFGFAVTMSPEFATIPKSAPSRPQPTPGCFPNSVFNISVTPASAALAGTCLTASPPTAQACN